MRHLALVACALAMAVPAIAPVKHTTTKSPPPPSPSPPAAPPVDVGGTGAAAGGGAIKDEGVTAMWLIAVSGIFGLLFSGFQLWQVSKIEVEPGKRGEGYTNMEEGSDTNAKLKLYEVYLAIQEGAKAFLFAEYFLMSIFIVVFGALVLVLTSWTPAGFDITVGGCTCIAFVLGALTSIVSGYVGMMVAVYSNARTTIAAEGVDEIGWTNSFNTAFRAGGSMGFSLTSLAMLMLCLLIIILAAIIPGSIKDDEEAAMEFAKRLFECVAGYGLGGSCIAMFGRVGGGIYTKAADVGADLAGKVVSGIPEDDPRNPATIADNVGDNVGDVAGMGSDLFGSYAESTCAALVVAAGSVEIISAGWGAILFPVTVSAVGILVCALSSFLATDISPVKKEEDVETVLKIQLGVTTILMVGCTYPLSVYLLPASFELGSNVLATPLGAWFCLTAGLVGGCIVGFVTEYYTSHSYNPVREVAQSCETGAATNIIYGLALGYKSAIIPITVIAAVTFIAFHNCGMYGVALGALGFLGTLATCLSIDVYGPVCDNAGGIAEMSELPSQVRDKTDALDAAGNTTAAIGKGFAIGSAALVSLALFGGFVTRIGFQTQGINVLAPITFAMLFMGAMLPYWFTALTMKSVGTAAMAMVKEVARQFEEIPGLLEGTPGHGPPDHAKCIKISTDASLKEMVAPGLLVILSPIIVGTVFGVQAVAGLLVGALTSGVQLAISQSNTGGAWDNAKKYVEKGCVSILVNGEPVAQRKGSELHKAAVCGDTVGDPLKDTSGPAINIVMKLMAIISLVFADYFMAINDGHGLLNVQ